MIEFLKNFPSQTLWMIFFKTLLGKKGGNKIEKKKRRGQTETDWESCAGDVCRASAVSIPKNTIDTLDRIRLRIPIILCKE